MRTTSLTLLALTTASLAVGKPAEGGSIEALLDRVSQRNDRSTVKKQEAHVPPTAPPAVKDVKAEKKEAEAPKEAHSHESKRSAHGKMAKRLRAKAEEENAKRWVWATGIIQDDPPSSAAPAVGSNANLLSSSTTIAVTTPQATPAPPSFPPLSPSSSSTTPAVAATTATESRRRPTWKAHSARSNKDEKRWVWSNSIVQDDTPAAQAPPVGANVNALQSSAVPVTTPAAKLAAPSFPPKAASSSSTTTPPAAAASASASAHVAVVPNQKRPTWREAHHARDVAEHEEEKRWVWGTSIIQDDTPAASAPAVGEKVNQLSSSAHSVTTPAATLVAPSFPPKSSQTPGPSSPLIAAVVASSEAADDAIITSSVTSTSAEATSTSSAHHWWNPKDLLEDIEEGFEKLFHHSSSATSVPVATPTMEKRYVWATGIIQDDTPAESAPAVGSNANLLSSSAPLNTPKATLEAPTFPPRSSSSSSSSFSSVAASSSPVNRVLVAPSLSSSTSAAVHTTSSHAPRKDWRTLTEEDESSSSTSASATHATVPAARLSFQKAHEAALEAAASQKAAAAAAGKSSKTTTTTSAAQTSATKSAAQKWTKVEPKVKRMVKRERK
ncbi:hypothetical protein JCM11641_007776 [Rhodosporidiobolus odoratus]